MKTTPPPRRHVRQKIDEEIVAPAEVKLEMQTPQIKVRRIEFPQSKPPHDPVRLNAIKNRKKISSPPPN